MSFPRFSLVAIVVLTGAISRAGEPLRPLQFAAEQQELRDIQAQITQSRPERNTTRLLQQGFQNPSFETLSGGYPTGWDTLRNPEIDTTIAADGSNSGKIGRLHAWIQSFHFSVPTWQNVTFTNRFYSEYAGERLQLYIQNTGTGDLASEAYFPDGRSLAARTWTSVYGAATRTPGSVSIQIFPRSRFDVQWLRVDDFAILFENPTGGDFETPGTGAPERDRWQLGIGAERSEEKPLRGAQSLLLAPGAEATRLAAHSPFAVIYFMTGLADAPLEVTEERLFYNGTLFETPKVEQAIPDASGRWTVEFLQQREAQAARLRLRSAGDETIRVDDVTRGWAYAHPALIEPTTNSPRITSRLAAAWPDRLESATIDILDLEGNLVLNLPTPQRDQTTVWLDFDGADLPAGTYRARFTLNDADGASVTLLRPLLIRRSAAYPAKPTPYIAKEFVRMAWMYLFPFSEEDLLTQSWFDERFALAKADGFNWAIVFHSPEQVPFIRAAAEKYGIRFIASEPVSQTEFVLMLGNRTFDPQPVLDSYRFLDGFLTSPMFEGVYIWDEPNVARRASFTDRVRQMALVIERDQRYKRGWTVLQGDLPLDKGDFGNVIGYSYPALRENKSSTAQILASAGHFEDVANLARDAGLPYWGVPLGYGALVGVLPMSPAEVSAHLGTMLSHGVTGYAPFMYTSLDDLSSMRTHTLQPTARLATFQDFNRRTAALSDLLLWLPPARQTPPQENVHARTAIGENDIIHTFITNPNPRNGIAVEVETAGLTTMTDVESRATSAAATLHSVQLAPGEWRLFRFSALPIRVTGTLLPAAREAGPAVQTLSRTNVGVARSLSFRPNGTALAATIGDNHRAYEVTPVGLGTLLLNNFADAFRGEVRYLADDILFGGSRRTGSTFYRQEGNSLSPFVIYQRITGGGVDSFTSNNEAWIAQSYWGSSIVDYSAGTLPVQVGYGPAANFDHRSIHGPNADGSANVFDSVGGLSRISRDGNTLTLERFSPRSAWNRGASSPTGCLAIGNLDQGMTVYDLDPKGRPARTLTINDPNLISAERLGWLTESILAVADAREGIRFYRITPDLAWEALGVWRPAEGDFTISSFATGPNGLLAIGFENGDLVIANAKSAIEAITTGWMLR